MVKVRCCAVFVMPIFDGAVRCGFSTETLTVCGFPSRGLKYSALFLLRDKTRINRGLGGGAPSKKTAEILREKRTEYLLLREYVGFCSPPVVHRR